MNRRAEDHDERSIEFAEKDGVADGLDDLSRAEKPMKIFQHKDRRRFVARRSRYGPNRSQRIARFSGNRYVSDGV